MVDENQLSNIIIGCAIEVHKVLGPGLLESAYENCFAFELMQKGPHVSTQVPMPIVYKEVRLDHGYRMDLLVGNRVVVEVKSVDFISDVHEAQLLTYLKLGNYKLGLILNFNTLVLKNGIKRMVNGL
jgi:GxxExxY protein